MTWLIPILPLIAFTICGTLAVCGKASKAAGLLGIAAVAASGVLALGAELPYSQSAHWLSIPGFLSIRLGVHLDSLSWLMVLVVCLVSLLVQIYSLGYMAGEAGYARYYAYLALFTASMLGLVVANNLFQLYVCWELVGVCSYLLVGFWWHKPSAASAAKKAFVVTRFGDVGFMLGVLLLASAAGSFDFAAAFTLTGPEGAALDRQAFVSHETLLWLAPLLLFCGAIGKSAQFPLHVWLPDAMEGPTPVSALIHAATMVAAGVYMVARLFPLFAASEIALGVVLAIGLITAFIAATIALVQTDIKKVMAYSTVSQLGMMMMGLGAGSVLAGMFHLTTHAMFKALLFLAAGSVIHAMHHAPDPNDLRQMGGLGGRMAITKWTCLAGVLALAGFPFLSGYYSKDYILAAAYDRGDAMGWIGLGGGLLVAMLTAFYSMRMWILAFGGKARSRGAEEASESPLTMALPLVALAVPSLALGFYLEQGQRFERLLGIHGAGHDPAHRNIAIVAALAALAGLAAAWRVYSKPEAAALDPVQRAPGAPLFASLWHIDAFWNRAGAGGSLAMGRLIAWFDRHVVDGAMNGIAWLCGRAGEAVRQVSSGQAQSYGAITVASLLALLVLFALIGGP